MVEYEDALENLKSLISWASENQFERNESDTRFHLIDKILIDVLGWDSEYIKTEDNYNSTYTDYTIFNPIPVIILEAKKQGISFELPVERNKKIIRKLDVLCNDNKGVEKAIDQVLNYCQERGVEIGMISNGDQWISFVANRRDGIPPKEGKAFVFESLNAMAENFLEFWNSNSREGIIEGYLKGKLTKNKLPKLPPKLSSTFDKYPGRKDRNPLQTDMQILSDLVLEDLIREKEVEEEFLRRCYSKSGALSQYSSVSKQILKTRYKFLFEEKSKDFQLESITSKKGLSEDLKEVISNSLSRRPILLIGDVGVGKSTFISNLIKVDGKAVFKKTISLRIDLGSRAILNLDLRKAIVKEIMRLLKDEYNTDILEDGFVRGTYHSKIQEFKNGIYKRLYETNADKALEKEIEFLENLQEDSIDHIKYSLDHISKAREKQIVIFIDNCDQRSDSVQQDAFLIAQEIAEDWSALVFITLRPETYYRSLKIGALSGYHPKAFTISPPRIEEVIIKRLEFAKKITSGEYPIKQINIISKLSNLEIMLDVLNNSLRRNVSLVKFIENISNENVRIAIDYVKQFLGSGHVDTKKIIDIVNSSDGRYIIPLHEFIRAVIFGDNYYYHPANTTITNLYDVTTEDEKEYFITLTLLSILNNKALDGSSDGFVDVVDLFESLQETGFLYDQIKNLLIRSFSRKLIETSKRGDINRTDKLPNKVRITSLGAYHISELVSNYTYFDAILIDIPIFDSEVFKELCKTNEFTISDRLERAELVLNYLDDVWERSNLVNNNFQWEDISEKLMNDFVTVRSKIH